MVEVVEFDERNIRRVLTSMFMYLNMAGYDGSNHCVLYHKSLPSDFFGDDKTGVTNEKYGEDLMLLADDAAFYKLMTRVKNEQPAASLAGAMLVAAASVDGTYKGSFDLAAGSMAWLLKKYPSFWSEHDMYAKDKDFNFVEWIHWVLAQVIV